MNIKSFLPMGEKPPDTIGWGFIASWYTVYTAHPFIQIGSLQVVQFYLALLFKSTSPARLVVIILCHAAELPSSTPLGHAPMVSTMTYPLPAHSLTIIFFFATTAAAAPNSCCSCYCFYRCYSTSSSFSRQCDIYGSCSYFLHHHSPVN